LKCCAESYIGRKRASYGPGRRASCKPASGDPAAQIKTKESLIFREEHLPSKAQPMGHEGEMICMALGCFFANERQLANLGNCLTAFG